MVFYFSGTGNSKYVAECIARKTEDEIVSLNKVMKQNSQDDFVSETQPFVFVCPTYAWRIPHVVEDLIKRSTFMGTRKVYFVVTCGGEAANTIHYVKKLCGYKEWELCGFAEVVMPDNYITMFPAIDEITAKEIIEKANPVIDNIADHIYQGKSFYNYTSKGFFGKIESGIINDMFYPMFVKVKGFYATDQCINCGKCVKLCPLNNIAINQSLPKWGNNCTHCMACINLCPTNAIEYKNKTQNKIRYNYFRE